MKSILKNIFTSHIHGRFRNNFWKISENPSKFINLRPKLIQTLSFAYLINNLQRNMNDIPQHSQNNPIQPMPDPIRNPNQIIENI